MIEAKVLDKGYVRYVDHCGNDLSVVRAARVSYNAEWRTGENAGADEKLISYMMNNGHSSPFEHVYFTFEVKAPISVFRQWHRHRTKSYNELSARYTEMLDEFYIPSAEVIGKQSKSNKQARDIVEMSPEELAKKQAEIDIYEDACYVAYSTYQGLLKSGWPRELARNVLPVCTYSKMFVSANLHNWYKFLTQRLHPHAQYEIRQYASAILKMIEERVPVSTAAWKAKESIA